MTRASLRIPFLISTLGLAVTAFSATAHAVSSSELYTTKAYPYGRFEARIHFAAGDGIISSFFLWKDKSEQDGVFWNELDFEKLGADCHLETNALYGDPEAVHVTKHALEVDLCGGFHTYAYEWTPEYIAWFLDGVEIRRDTGDTAAAYAENAPDGMQLRFNVWPGVPAFGGKFDPATMPVHQYINWVQYSSYADGAFTLQWREDFTNAKLPSGWATGNWDSPKGKSTHSRANVNFIDGYAVLSLTADDATGSTGAAPSDSESPSLPPTTGGAGGAGNLSTSTAATAGSTSDPGAGGVPAETVATSPAITSPVGLGGAATATPGATGTTAPPGATSDDGGCSVAPSKNSASGIAALLGAVLATALLRRKRH